MKPMLAVQCKDITKLRFPVYASPKLDGIRALVVDGVLMSRSLKPIPNEYAQALFSQLPHGTDGELILGDPFDDPYRRTVSAVMSEDGTPPVCFHVFDNFDYEGGFLERYNAIRGAIDLSGMHRKVIVVPHHRIENHEDLLAFEQKMLDKGFEGAMTRSPDGPYKFGRSTEKEGFLLKIKRFLDGEAKIISCYERMHNNNEAKTNALGRTERSSHQENKIGRGDLGGFDVVGVGGDYNGIEFSIGTGFDDEERGIYWALRDKTISRIVTYKYFPTGSKDAPRFPVFKGFRDPIDM